MSNDTNNGMETATLANGCFWCSEAIFSRIKGIKSVLPGYAGGEIENPTYEEVCRGRTGHAESIQIEFDPKIISFEKILDVFWRTHDPTTLNRQGNDIGTQYRSSIFYHTSEQEKIANQVRQELDDSKFQNKIVTEIVAASTFYPAEEYHQKYYQKIGGGSCYNLK